MHRGTHQLPWLRSLGSPRTLQAIILTCVLCFTALLAVFVIHDPESPRFTWISENVPEKIRTLESISHFDVITPDNRNCSSYRSFKSSPVTPPHLNITRYEGALADGLLLFTPKSRDSGINTIKAAAPYIVDSDGDLIYAHNVTDRTNNFRMQTVNGSSFLQWWEGESVIGHGYGKVFMLDDEYQETSTYLQEPVSYKFRNLSHAVPGYMDFHEQRMTERGTLLVTAYSRIPMNLSFIEDGPEEGALMDSMFFEMDIATGETLFRWSAADHFPVNGSRLEMRSYMGTGRSLSPYDFFHINSVQDLEEGYLISSRHFWSIYLISKEDGHVIWTFDGSGDDDNNNGGGSFGILPYRSQFRWQHDAGARVVNSTYMEISLFDNHCTRETNQTVGSRGMLFGLQLPPDPSNTPVLLRTAHGPVDFYSDSQGSYDPFLNGGNQLVNFGPVPVAQEFGPAGELRWEARYGEDYKAASYRVFKQDWRGTPRSWDPSLAIHGSVHKVGNSTASVKTIAYVSWNGATDVSAWNVYVRNRDDPESVECLGKAMKRGFETAFEVVLEGRQNCVQVAAVQEEAEVRRSNIACLDDDKRVIEDPSNENNQFLTAT